ncbi:MAG: hypothetical protein QOH21_98 [Acidobacteriota bacterium]|jgi:nucleoside-diphosphate-sugar epimerase|nr:hypothetical protein [Acidobacteriota bacterium]
MSRLLLTGATGFIGRQLALAAVARGWEVHAPVRVVPEERVDGVEYHAVDLLDDPAGVRQTVAAIGASHMLHLAWYAVPGLYWTSAENFRWVTASMALGDAFRDAGGRRLVVAGSCAEYDWRFGFCSESVTPLAPATTYGVAKNALRSLLASWSVQSDVSFAWGRIFFLYGPGEPRPRLVPSVVTSLLAGRTAECTAGTQVRDFLHVRDVAEAFLALLASEVEGPVNIASGQAVAVRDVIQTIAGQLGKTELVALGARPMPDEPPLVVADIRRLQREVQWSPRYDLAAGLRETIEWWRENG